jgi:hypothetical protein
MGTRLKASLIEAQRLSCRCSASSLAEFPAHTLAVGTAVLSWATRAVGPREIGTAHRALILGYSHCLPPLTRKRQPYRLPLAYQYEQHVSAVVCPSLSRSLSISGTAFAQSRYSRQSRLFVSQVTYPLWGRGREGSSVLTGLCGREARSPEHEARAVAQPQRGQYRSLTLPPGEHTMGRRTPEPRSNPDIHP